MQSALTMSLPRRMPPSSRISVWPSTACDDFGQHANGRRDAVELPRAVIRHDDRRRALGDRAPRIVGGVHALGDDRPAPRLADPLEVVPRRHRRFERRADIGVAHRAVGEHDVRESSSGRRRRRTCRASRASRSSGRGTGTVERLRASSSLTPLRASRSRMPATGVSMVTTSAL